MRRQYKPKPGAQEVLPLFPELPMPCTQKKTPDGPPSAGAQGTDQNRPKGHRHDGALVTASKLAGGRFLFYHATDKWLLQAGLIAKSNLPRLDIGHCIVINGTSSFCQAVRLPDGNVGLTIDAGDAVSLDRHFIKFLAAACESDALPASEVIQSPGGRRAD